VTSRHGDPAETVAAAFRALDNGRIRVVAQSRLYRTPFVPAGAGPDVINAAALLGTDLAPGALLQALHRIETDFDRTRAARWGSRTLDLDLLMVGQRVMPDRDTFLHWQAMPVADQQTQAPEELILPHPQMAARAFVLVPAAEVAPGWRHPVFGETLAEMLAALPGEDVAAVRPLEG